MPPFTRDAGSLTAIVRRLALRARIRVGLWRAGADPAVRTGESDRQHVFVALAADYGNLGDLAITYAQTEFLRRQFPDAVVEPIPISRTLGAIKRLRKVIQNEDLITLIGGGNTSDMYDDIQYLRELVIRNFPNNRIISFPQTVDFSPTLYGRWAARRARKTYAAHRHLLVLARDSRSLERVMDWLPRDRVSLAPDVVLTLDKSEPAQTRHGVLLALRADLEQGLPADINMVAAMLGEIGPVTRTDTHVGDVRLSERDATSHLEAFWQQCRSAELMVTDRLHGMIFALITGTPCVVFDSSTGKVGQFYRDWLADIDTVRLVSRFDDLTSLASDVMAASSEVADLRERAKQLVSQSLGGG